MKTYILIITLLGIVILGYSQAQHPAKQLTAAQTDSVSIKLKKYNAPDSKNFSTEAEYLKAKAKWVENNKSLYQEIIKMGEKR